MKLFKNEQPHRKGFLQEEKGRKIIHKQDNRRRNIGRTVYCENIKPGA